MPIGKKSELEFKFPYRNALDAVKFLLGYEGFKDDLVYEPYRTFTETADGEK